MHLFEQQDFTKYFLANFNRINHLISQFFNVHENNNLWLKMDSRLTEKMQQT